jgi:phosphomannomutase/phosphoglucomutase
MLEMSRKVDKTLFGTNGVRGIFGTDLTPEIIIRLSKSLAHHFPQGPLAVGFDGRNSSPIIFGIVCSALNSEGRDTRVVGLVPTPCLQYAVKYRDFGGGLMITASHNPPEYNGIKPVAFDGVEISREDELKVQEIFNSGENSPNAGPGRELFEENIVESYMGTVLSLVDVEKIRRRELKIVIDGGNGVQGPVGSLLAKRLGCKVITLDCNIDGDFPGRGPEPTVDNLKSLSGAVIDAGADLGVAYDGDGDRSIYCDEKGQAYPGDRTGALLTKFLLATKHFNTDIVCPINTTLAVPLVAKEAKAKVVFTKVGSVAVSREMVKRKSIIGMEENGGFMYGQLNEVRDGAMTTALVLEMLATYPENGLSELMYSLPKIFQFKSKYPCPAKEIALVVLNKVRGHGSPKKIEALDGVKVWIDDETWIMVRASGTEPILRLYAESTDKNLLNSKVDEYDRLIKQQLRIRNSP